MNSGLLGILGNQGVLGNWRKEQEAISWQLTLNNFLASINQRIIVRNTGSGTGLQNWSPSHRIPQSSIIF